mgnify:CR=1 FL=1
MSIYKDNVTGKWRVVYRYTDWTGETHQSSKRGFPTKREALMWERELLLKKEAKLDMTSKASMRFMWRICKIESVIIPGEQKQISPEQKFFPISESER